jgi:RNA polymerase sigma factor (TIGR02999 family)
MPESGDKRDGTITHLLRQARMGHQPAVDELFDKVYQQLKRLARGQLAGQVGDRRLEVTSLVHAACHKLMRKGPLDAEDRRHFFFLFGRAMQDVLAEEARHDLAQKRGGGRRRVPLAEFEADSDTFAADILDLRQALDELRRHDPNGAQIVMLRYFCGLTLEETAETMECTLAAVRRDWDYARAWLHERMTGPRGTAES